jgi:hypothetical protein
MSRVAVLRNPADGAPAGELRETEAAAESLKVKVILPDVREVADLVLQP